MRRREFITLLGGTVVAWPLAARAQQPAKLPTVGFIGSDTPDAYAVLLRAFRVGLKATGFIEGNNVAIEYRWAEGHYDRLSALAADLVGRLHARCKFAHHRLGDEVRCFRFLSGYAGAD
jgi:putative tryptophan/tyrosine transport system substrate-binding protein